MKKYSPLFIFVLITTIYFFPLLSNLNSVLLGYFGDKAGMRYRLKYGISTDSQPLFKLILTFFYKLFGDPAAYNSLIILSFFLALVFAYLFFKHFFSKSMATILSIVFAFSPYLFYHSYNHADLSQIWVFPLYFLLLVKLEENFSLKLSFLAGLCLVLVTLMSNYYGYFLILFTVLFFLIRSGQDWASVTKRLRYYAVIAGAFLVLIVPVLRFYLVSYYSPPAGVVAESLPVPKKRSLADFVGLSARPWYYLLPSVGHPVLGDWSASVHQRIKATGYFLNDDFFREEHSGIFLGWVNLILASLAVLVVFCRVLRSKSETRISKFETNPNFSNSNVPNKGEQVSNLDHSNFEFVSCFGFRISNFGDYGSCRSWILTFFLVGVLLACFSGPPFFTISGHTFYTPSWILMKLFPMFRVLARLGILILLCVLVLAGYALSFLTEHFLKETKKQGNKETGKQEDTQYPISNIQYPIWKLGIVLGRELSLIYLLFAASEFYQPYYLTDVSQTPEVYQWLAQQPPGLVFVRPPGEINPSLFWEKDHQHQVVTTGYEGLFPDTDNLEHFTQQVLKGDRPFSSVLDLGVKYIIYHRDVGESSLEEEGFWTSQEELEVVKDFGGVAVFGKK